MCLNIFFPVQYSSSIFLNNLYYLKNLEKFNNFLSFSNSLYVFNLFLFTKVISE